MHGDSKSTVVPSCTRSVSVYRVFQLGFPVPSVGQQLDWRDIVTTEFEPFVDNEDHFFKRYLQKQELQRAPTKRVP